MKANIPLLINIQEIEEAERMGITKPPENFQNFPFLCKLSKVDAAYQTPDDEIFVVIERHVFSIQYSDEIWAKLQEQLK